jgi:1,4-alpha-glucan branching enzyme
MPLGLSHINDDTPMGAELVAGGATFRCWAPRARAVHVTGRFEGRAEWEATSANLMTRDWRGYWSGFLPGVRDGDEYKFFVVGGASSGYKRDPYARELTREPVYPLASSVVRDPSAYRWHDKRHRDPAFHDLIVYQLHVGTFHGPTRETRVAKFLDVLDRLDYLIALGVTTLSLLPVVEYSPASGARYDGGDLFSPEPDFIVPPEELGDYLPRVNSLFARCNQPPLLRADLVPAIHQLKALVDLCHLHGISVIIDVAFNGVGPELENQDESLWFFDRAPDPSDPNESLYFTDQPAQGRAFALWKREIRQFLIDNAKFWIQEYHVNGLRYVNTNIVVQNNPRDGWHLAQHMTGTVRFASPSAIQIAEYSPPEPRLTRSVADGGAGFDAVQHEGLCNAIRKVLGESVVGRDAAVDLRGLATNLASRGVSAQWRRLTCLENPRCLSEGTATRVAHLADPGNARSWYARSRARVATGLLLTAPGIPMLFMGQELLEDKAWHEDVREHPASLLWWEGLQSGDRAMLDFLRFTQDVVRLRRRQPALRSDNINVYHVNEPGRVLAFHRWLHETGRDVVVALSLSETTHQSYELGFPRPGHYAEVFNSDTYDNWVNPQLAGNAGGVHATGRPLHGLATSAHVVIPANGLVVFAYQG